MNDNKGLVGLLFDGTYKPICGVLLYCGLCLFCALVVKFVDVWVLRKR